MTTVRASRDEQERKRIISPFALLISIIRDISGNNELQHKAAFKQWLADPNYEQYRDVVIDEWLSIKYSTALEAARPPTVAQLRQNQQMRQVRVEEQLRAVDVLKNKIRGRLLQLVMPNGKKLAQCTGAECIEFGGWYTTIGEYVGANNLVGKVLNESDILRLLGRS